MLGHSEEGAVIVKRPTHPGISRRGSRVYSTHQDISVVAYPVHLTNPAGISHEFLPTLAWDVSALGICSCTVHAILGTAGNDTTAQ